MMKMKPASFLAGCALTLATCAAVMQPMTAEARRDDQADAREQMRAGNVRSLREIEAMVVPRMRGMEYLGPEYDSSAKVYRLKFIKADRVVFVDVDARTGSVLRQSR